MKFLLFSSLILFLAVEPGTATSKDLTLKYTQKGLFATSSNLKHSLQQHQHQNSGVLRPFKNEDRGLVQEFKNGGHKIKVYAVFDGHGGARVSQFVKDHFVSELERNFPLIKDHSSGHNGGQLTDLNVRRIKQSLQRTIDSIDEVLCSTRNDNVRENWFQGSTAAIIVSMDKLHFFAFNLGDSEARIYIDNELEYYSDPHTVDYEYEQFRIKEAGGEIGKDHQGPRIGGILVPSRGFGDCHFKQRGEIIREFDELTYHYDRNGVVTVSAPIKYVKARSKANVLLILGTDGLFDVIPGDVEDKTLFNLISGSRGKAKAKDAIGGYANDLISYALDKYSVDDITVIVDEYDGSLFGKLSRLF